MKLRTDEVSQLLAAAGFRPGEPFNMHEFVGDACELLTAKIVVRLRARAKMLEDEILPLATDPQDQIKVTAAVGALNKFAAELSEME